MHEAMGPLTAIKGSADSLIRGTASTRAERLEFARLIDKSADRLAELMERLPEMLKAADAEGGKGKKGGAR